MFADLDTRHLAPTDRPWMASAFAMSLDGRIAIDGHAAGIGSRRDMEHLHALRAHADAVLLGAGTLRAERYGTLLRRADHERVVPERVARGQRPHPALVVVTSSLDLPWDAGVFTSGLGEVLVAVPAGGTTPSLPETATPTGVLELPATNGRIDLAALLRHLRIEHDVASVLCEGGADLHRDAVAAGVLDELFVTIAPRLVGQQAAPTLLAGADLPTPVDLELVELVPVDGELFGRWRIRQ